MIAGIPKQRVRSFRAPIRLLTNKRLIHAVNSQTALRSRRLSSYRLCRLLVPMPHAESSQFPVNY